MQPFLANNPFIANTGNPFKKIISRPYSDREAFSNSFEAEATIILPVLNKRKKIPTHLHWLSRDIYLYILVDIMTYG